MSRDVKYYVLGFFQGTYKTLQEYPVTSMGQIPQDDKHLIRIIRGVISNAKHVNQDAFNQSSAEVQLKHVNNVQINKSPEWPEQNDRIFSCETFKLKNVKFTNVQVINSHTYGDVTGYVVASVTEGIYEEIEKDNTIEKDEKKPKPFWDRWNRSDRNEENQIFVILENHAVKVINHIYSYTVILDTNSWLNVVSIFDNEVEKRRDEFEKEITSNIKHSLKNILTKIQ